MSAATAIPSQATTHTFAAASTSDYLFPSVDSAGYPYPNIPAGTISLFTDTMKPKKQKEYSRYVKRQIKKLGRRKHE
jgi:hypothetical protein